MALSRRFRCGSGGGFARGWRWRRHRWRYTDSVGNGTGIGRNWYKIIEQTHRTRQPGGCGRYFVPSSWLPWDDFAKAASSPPIARRSVADTSPPFSPFLSLTLSPLLVIHECVRLCAHPPHSTRHCCLSSATAYSPNSQAPPAVSKIIFDAADHRRAAICQ